MFLLISFSSLLWDPATCLNWLNTFVSGGEGVSRAPAGRVHSVLHLWPGDPSGFRVRPGSVPHFSDQAKEDALVRGQPAHLCQSSVLDTLLRSHKAHGHQAGTGSHLLPWLEAGAALLTTKSGKPSLPCIQTAGLESKHFKAKGTGFLNTGGLSPAPLHICSRACVVA